jgi:hypothetical protein
MKLTAVLNNLILILFCAVMVTVGWSRYHSPLHIQDGLEEARSPRLLPQGAPDREPVFPTRQQRRHLQRPSREPPHAKQMAMRTR